MHENNSHNAPRGRLQPGHMSYQWFLETFV